MIREVDLVSMLPPFLAEYRELRAALEAENPEFVLVWRAADRVLRNEFIATADEYGIGRFEKMLNIPPSKGDSLETRRTRVLSRWFTALPYTWRRLLQKLSLICGDGGFLASMPGENGYRITICIRMDGYEGPHLREVRRMLEGMVPVNMVVLLFGEYEARCEASPDVGERITFRSGFYPRFNLGRLKLDRLWRLDGDRRLTGYDSRETVDLYPVCMNIRTEVSGAPEKGTRLSMTGAVCARAGDNEAVSVRIPAPCQETCRQTLRVKASAPVGCEVGEVTIYNQNRLDGNFRLDGKRKLNGGRELR